MTTKTAHAAKAGDTLTLLGSLTLPTGGLEGEVFHRGFVLTITKELLEWTRDRTGASFLDDVSEESQLARWGEVKLVPGDQSEKILWWNGGDSASRGLARTQAGELAREISDPKERRAAIAEADELYGRKMTSHTIAEYAPDAEQSYGPGKRS